MVTVISIKLVIEYKYSINLYNFIICIKSLTNMITSSPQTIVCIISLNIPKSSILLFEVILNYFGYLYVSFDNLCFTTVIKQRSTRTAWLFLVISFNFLYYLGMLERIFRISYTRFLDQTF